MTGHSESEPQLRVTWYGRTVVGKVRTNNEDMLWAARVADSGAAGGDTEGTDDVEWPGVLMAVADGMGGALAGEVASRLAVETIADELRRMIDDGRAGPTSQPDALRDALVKAVEQANQRIRAEGESNPQRRGMGTTLTVIWMHGASDARGAGEIAQVGDSRLYLFRGGHLVQLTKDQSLVGKLIEDGIITEDEAERIAGRNIILQALGSEEELEVVHQREGLQPGDLLLLCTDGLSGVVNNTDLEAELRRSGGADAICARLIALAEERGGPDNITVLLGKVESA